MHQCFKTRLDARRPGGGVTKLGRTGCPGGMACRTLALEDVFATAQRAVGVAHFDHADLLNAFGDGLFWVGGPHGRFVGRSDIHDQANDGKDRDHKRANNRDQQLFGVLDRAGMGFFVLVVAHDVLWCIGGFDVINLQL